MYKSFTEMPVWQKAMDVAEECFYLSENLPRKEDYALTSQLRRSATSISANIAEGFGRKSPKDKSHFYIIAKSTAMEVQNHILYGIRVKYFQEKDYEQIEPMINDIIHELNKIIIYLQRP